MTSWEQSCDCHMFTLLTNFHALHCILKHVIVKDEVEQVLRWLVQ